MVKKIKKVLHRIRQICLGQKGVYCQIGKRNRISGRVYLHEMAQIGHSNYIGTGTKIINARVGNYCSIADGVKIGLMEHDLKCVSTSWRIFEPKQGISNHTGWIEPSIVENDVWIAANAVIKQGVKVHTGAVIGAGAVVVKDVPPYAIVGGVPAKLICYRFDNVLIKEIMDSEWWKLPEEKARSICKQLQRKINTEYNVR